MPAPAALIRAEFTHTSSRRAIIVNINFIPINNFGDIRVIKFSQKDANGFAARCQFGARGRMKYYSNTLELSSKTTFNNALIRWEKTVAAHEIGHGFGLTHAPNWSNSIMSYSSNRQMTYRDADNLRLQFLKD